MPDGSLRRETEVTGDKTRKVLLEVGDGPEGFCFYTSDNEAVTDFATHYPALYLTASLNGASFKLGPFSLSTIQEQLKEKLK